MNYRLVAGFVLGGLVFTVLTPVFAALATVAIVGFVIFLVLVMLMPGGWLLLFGFRTVTGLLKGVLTPLVLLLAAGLLGSVVSSSMGFEAGMVFSFLLGGLMGVYAVSKLGGRSVRQWYNVTSPVSAARHVQRSSQPVPEFQHPPKKFDIPLLVVKRRLLMSRVSGISFEALKTGVVVVGEGSVTAVRTLVKHALEKYRVVVIGSPYLAAPEEKTTLVTLGKTSINILRPPSNLSRFAFRKWAENIAVPLVASAGLDTAEAGMVVRFIEKFGGAKIMPEDVDKLVAEYGPTSSARLKDALGMLTTFFGEGYPTPDKLFSGGWRQLVIDIRGLSQEAQLFIGMYLLYEATSLFPGCVVVFDSAELGVPEQQTLPYDARHVWLRTLKAVEKLRQNGFVMAASTGLLAPELLDLADTYIVTRGPASMRRSLSERIGVDFNLAAIPAGAALVFTRASPDGRPYLFQGELITTPVVDIDALKADEDRRNTLLAEEMLSDFKDTMLFAELADMSELGYRVLKAVKISQNPTPEKVRMELGAEAEKAVKHLLDKGYILLDPAGVLGLTSLGEHALRDWEQKVRKTEAARTDAGQNRVEEKTAIAVDAGLSAYGRTNTGDYGEVYRLLNRARSMLMKQDQLTAVGTAYKAAVTVLKTLTGVEKGHLPELAEKAREKGLVNISDEEARRLFAANIEAKRLAKQVSEGGSVSEEDRKRMADAAELLISLAERVAALAENPVDEVSIN